MEDKILDEFELFCKFNCKYKSGNPIIEKLVYNDHKEMWVLPCDYCQVEEFIRECSDRL